jgi:hypothetical protein
MAQTQGAGPGKGSETSRDDPATDGLVGASANAEIMGLSIQGRGIPKSFFWFLKEKTIKNQSKMMTGGTPMT